MTRTARSLGQSVAAFMVGVAAIAPMRGARADAVDLGLNTSRAADDHQYIAFNNSWRWYLTANSDSEVVHFDPSIYNTDRSWWVDFNIAKQGNGNDNNLKSYPSIIYGWQYGLNTNYTKDANGISHAIRVGDEKNLYTTWDFSVRIDDWSSYQADIAYDLWYHDSQVQGGETPTTEVMIWVNYFGPYVLPTWMTDNGTANIGGVDYEVYSAATDNWPLYIFARKQTTYSTTLNLKDFNDYLQNNPSVVPGGRGWSFDGNKYLSSVQAGTEIWYGSGSLYTNKFSVSDPY